MNRLGFRRIATAVLLAALPGWFPANGLAQEPGVVPPPEPAPVEEAPAADPVEAARLPEGYKPPRNPDPALLITKEIVPKIDGEDGLTWYKRNKVAFQKAMNYGNLTGSNRDIVDKGIQVLVTRLSLEANRPVLPDLRNEIKRWMDRAASLQEKENTRRQFREFVLEKVIENSKKLLDNHLEVRLSAMILLNNCYVELENERKGRTQEFYAPTYPTFLEVLNDKTQHDVVRIWAAKGLRKVLDEANIRDRDRLKIAEALMAQIVPGTNNPWLDMRIAEAAGDSDIVRFGGAKPIIVEGLAKVLNDDSRDCLVRSEAAKQLARVKPDPSYNLTLFAHQTVRLVKEMAVKQAADPKSAKWRVCFLNSYLAFMPEDVDARNKRKAGLLLRAEKTGHEKYVGEAFDQTLPAIRHVLGKTWTTPIAPQTVGAMDGWLKSHPPEDWKPTPDLEPLDVQRVAEKGPTPEPAG